MTEMEQSPENTPTLKGWTYQGVFVINTLLFMVVMAADCIVNHTVTMWSEVGILVITVIAALKVRRNDLTAVVWSPPIVWLIALETVGQIDKQEGGTAAHRQLLHLSYGLANHAMWILGSVIVAIVITTIRRFRNS